MKFGPISASFFYQKNTRWHEESKKEIANLVCLEKFRALITAEAEDEDEDNGDAEVTDVCKTENYKKKIVFNTKFFQITTENVPENMDDYYTSQRT